MKHSNIRQRLLLITLLPSALMAIALVTFFTMSGLRTLESDLNAHGHALVRYLAPISEYGIISRQIESLHVLAQTSVQEPGVKAAIIVNQRGRAIAVSGRVSLGSEHLRRPPQQAGVVAENENWIAFGAPVMRSLSEADALYEPMTSGVENRNEVIGAVFVEFDKGELAQRQRALVLRGLAIVGIGLLLLAMLAIAIADSAAHPVRRLVMAVRSMSNGQFDTRVNADSSGEFGILERGFNEMAGHIEDVHASMQERIEEATAMLVFQARHDALTGLLNRREFEQRLERALLNVQAGGEECSVLFIDLDRFKPVNDTCGHLAGDELLRQISQLFQGRLREEDTLARVGGDEFCILLDNCTGPRARQVAEDICGLAAAYRFIWQDKVFAIGASIGLSTVSRNVRNINDILAAGDAACYRAKESGRNQVIEQLPNAQPERRQEANGWSERISGALADGRVLIEAMPLRALQSDVMTGHLVEISARLSEPGQPSISLSALIDAAERNDLAPTVDRYFIDQAIKALARAEKHGKELHCLVPISLASICQRDTASYIAQQLAIFNVGGRGLCLLFSEEESARKSTQVLEFSRSVRSVGCRIALDDFGGGLSSFSHLRAIAPDCVKLSRSLTRDLNGNRASTALLRAVQEITSDLDIYTLADGVDDSAGLQQLSEIGITYAEGLAVAPSEPFQVWFEGVVMRS